MGPTKSAQQPLVPGTEQFCLVKYGIQKVPCLKHGGPIPHTRLIFACKKGITRETRIALFSQKGLDEQMNKPTGWLLHVELWYSRYKDCEMTMVMGIPIQQGEGA